MVCCIQMQIRGYMTQQKKRSPLSVLANLFLFLLALLVIFVASLPTLLSSSFGKEKLVSTINQSIPGKIHIDGLSLSWLGSQSIQGLSLADPQNSPVLSLENLKIDSSLIKLLTHSVLSGQLAFNQLNAKIVSDANGNTNLMRAIDSDCCELSTTENRMSISLNNTHGSLNFPSNTNLVSLELFGETEQNTLKGKFTINADLPKDHLTKADGDISRLLQNLKINADIINFPTELLDQIVTLRSPKFTGLINELIGNALNVKIDQNNRTDGIRLNVTANSPTLEAQAELLLSHELTLAQPASIKLNVSPIGFEKILKVTNPNVSWQLKEPITAHVVITELNLPANVLKSDKLDINALGLKGILDLNQAVFQGKTSAQSLVLKGLHATIETEANTQTTNIVLNSEAVQNGHPAKINFNLKLPKTFLLGDFSFLSLKDVTLTGNLSHFPLFALDELTKLPISSLAGPLADIGIDLKAHDSKPLANIKIMSDYLEIPGLSFWVGPSLTLEKPAQILLKLNQTFVNSLLDGPQIKAPAVAQLMINSLSVPLSEDVSFVKIMTKSDLNALLKVTTLRLSDLPKAGGVSFNDVNIKFLANAKTRPEIFTTFSLQPDGSSTLTDLLGKKTFVKTIVNLDEQRNGQIDIPLFNVEMTSELAHLRLSGGWQDRRLFLNSPATLSYIVTSAGLKSLGIAADHYIFQQGSPLELTIDSSFLPNSFEDLSHLQLNGKLKANDLQLTKSDLPNVNAMVDHLSADWVINGEQKQMSISFDGITRLGENQAVGKITGSAELLKWIQNGSFNLTDAKINLHANASKLPTELLNVLTGQKNLVPILGNAIDLLIEANTPLIKTEKGIISINIHSENLSGSVGLALGDVIQLNHSHPAQFSLKLTPRGYTALRQSINEESAGNFVLSETANVSLKINSVHIPRSNLFQSGMEVDFSMDPIIGMDPRSKSKIFLNFIKGHLTSTHLAENIHFKLNAKGQEDQKNATSWEVLGNITNGFNSRGQIDKENLSLSLDATVAALPVPLLCQFVCVDEKLKNKIEVMLGPRIDAKIKAQLQKMNGPLYVALNGQNGRLTIDAMLKQGILTLNENLTAELTVTPQLGEYVLKDMIPVLSGMLSADHPIHLTIAKEGFAVPLKNLSIANASIGKAVLDMGKVHFSGESQIAKVLDLLTPASSSQLVWLTPAYFSLKSGILKLERVDMLISDRYPIAAWGDVDIGKDRVNMVIGLAGIAISKAFNVPKISNSYVLQLPLKGKLSNPSIDRTKALARISSLVAQSQGGAEGLVLGKVLDIASGGFAEGAAPSPTTNPLPWAELMQDNASNDSKSAEESKKTTPNPLNEIEKGASSILKKIFR